MMERQGFIYGIRLKGANDVFYVGQTKKTIAGRIRQHMKGTTPVSRFLQMFGDLSFFEVEILDTVDVSQLNGREKYWIAHLNTRHPKGLNQMPGGDVHEHSERTKRRLSEVMKAKCADPVYRAQMSLRNAAQWADANYRSQQAAGFDKVRATVEYREKLGASKRRLWEDPRHRERMAKNAKDQWLDPGQREIKTERLRRACSGQANKTRQSENKKALWADPVWKAKQVAAVKEGLARRRQAALVL